MITTLNKIFFSKALRLPFFFLFLVIFALFAMVIYLLPKFYYYSSLVKKDEELKLEFTNKQKIASTLIDHQKQLVNFKKEINNRLAKYACVNTKLLKDGRWDNFNEQNNQAITKLDDDSQIVAKLIKKISMACTKNNLDIILFKPGEYVSKDFYKIFKFNIKLTGKYQQIYDFFISNKSLPYLFDWHSFKIYKNLDKRKGFLTLELSLYTYCILL